MTVSALVYPGSVDPFSDLRTSANPAGRLVDWIAVWVIAGAWWVIRLAGAWLLRHERDAAE